MTNYPAGLTQGQHDRIFADDPNESRYGNEETCFLCHRQIVQDTFTRFWYPAEDVEAYGFEDIGYSKAIDPFQVAEGWICSVACFNDHTVMTEEEETAYRGLHLVKRAAAHAAYRAAAMEIHGEFAWNENVALNEDESIPARPTLQLVKGGRA